MCVSITMDAARGGRAIAISITMDLGLGSGHQCRVVRLEGSLRHLPLIVRVQVEDLLVRVGLLISLCRFGLPRIPIRVLCRLVLLAWENPI